MTTQATNATTNAKQSWAQLVRAYAAIARELNARLSSEHDLTKNEYEVLLLLARAEEFRLRRIDIATELILSPSGITRMLDRLGAAGLVDKAECASDRRVSYAVLTDDGMSRLKAAGRSHDAVIEELVGGRLAKTELKTLSEILERLPSVEGEAECSIEDE